MRHAAPLSVVVAVGSWPRPAAAEVLDKLELPWDTSSMFVTLVVLTVCVAVAAAGFSLRGRARAVPIVAALAVALAWRAWWTADMMYGELGGAVRRELGLPLERAMDAAFMLERDAPVVAVLPIAVAMRRRGNAVTEPAVPEARARPARWWWNRGR